MLDELVAAPDATTLAELWQSLDRAERRTVRLTLDDARAASGTPTDTDIRRAVGAVGAGEKSALTLFAGEAEDDFFRVRGMFADREDDDVLRPRGRKVRPFAIEVSVHVDAAMARLFQCEAPVPADTVIEALIDYRDRGDAWLKIGKWVDAPAIVPSVISP